MNLIISILNGKGEFMCSAFASDREGVLRVIDNEHQSSIRGFHDDRKDFLPLEYQVAAAEIFDPSIGSENRTDDMIGRWGRNTGLVWYK